MTELTTEDILGELISTVAVTNAELEALQAQTAKQTDTINEVKRHGEAVRKSVDMGNLGEHVFKGVASAVYAKLEETSKCAEQLSGATTSVVIAQERLAEHVQERVKFSETVNEALTTTINATRQATRAADKLTEARRRDWVQSPL